jgi:hypothetical protein
MPIFAGHHTGETASTSGLVEVESYLHVLSLPPQSFAEVIIQSPGCIA